jgi:predicted peroxiredoxin
MLNEKMSEELMLVYGWGPEEDGKLSSLLYIAETALSMGMKTSIFLYTDAAILAKRGNMQKIGGELYSRFRRIANHTNIRLYVCEEAARKRAINSENLEEKLILIGYATFLDIATKTKTVITI